MMLTMLDVLRMIEDGLRDAETIDYQPEPVVVEHWA